jgi:hypothetical protein
MMWPLSQDYNEAIQSPSISFSDPELKAGQPVTNTLGIPQPRSGNFADVYEFDCPQTNSKWAIKCFTREVRGLRERYAEISKHLGEAKLPFTVEFHYLQQGIRIRGSWYPVLKMRWVEGLLLNDFVRDNLDHPARLQALAQIWLRMAKRLRDGNLAHADLQHGNVILVPGNTANALAIKLIDYDGMWVPALASRPSGEVGHPNYQHPARLTDGSYALHIDRFPLLVVATALKALAISGRQLWERYDNGDNLLFKESDLRAPEQSPLFKHLLAIGDGGLRSLVERLKHAAGRPIQECPLLDPPVPPKPVTPTKRAAGAVQTSAAEGSAFDFDSKPTRRPAHQQGRSRRPLIAGAAGAGVLVAALAVGAVVWATRPEQPVAQAKPEQPNPPDEEKPRTGTPPGRIRVDLELPAEIRVPIGGKTAVGVQLKRGDYTGPLKLVIDNLPTGVSALAVAVPEGDNSASIELKCEEDVKVPFELQEFRLSARVNGKEVGSRNGTFSLVRPKAPVKPLDPPLLDPTIQPPQAVSLTTADGVTLRGTLYPSPKGVKGPTVLMVPEPSKLFSRKDDNWVRLARSLQKLGCSVLTFDFRGFGENGQGLDTLPASFWNYNANRVVLLPHLRKIGATKFGTPTTLDGTQFPPGYLPWLVQDIVAARFFLDVKHDEGELNSRHLIVIAAGEGATLATIWYVSECRRSKADARSLIARPTGPFENRDVIAAIWLDNRLTLGKLNLTAPLGLVRKTIAAEKTHLSMLFVYDKALDGVAKGNSATMKIFPAGIATEKPIESMGLSGQALLGDRAAEKAILDYVSDLLKKHEMRPHSSRSFLMSLYYWNFNGGSYYARSGLSPLPLPLDGLGFKLLTAR